MKKYIKVWLTTSLLSMQTSLQNRVAALLFTLGKFVRFFLFLYFLTIIHTHVDRVASYSLEQMITFFLIFNLVDLFGQLFFRGIYWFREQIVSGEFDFRLVKPMSSLFQVLTRQTDILDLPLLVLVIVMLSRQGITLDLSGWVMVLGIVIAAVIIITAIHILVAALGVVSTEVDHTIMIYRDLSQMARFPIDIYTELIRGFLTFVVPIGLAFTLPAKALLGIVTPDVVVLSMLASIIVLSISLVTWRYSLRLYTSASS